jgi:hypothetical protein
MVFFGRSRRTCETWTDFHKKYHSDGYRYSAANHELLRKSQQRRLSLLFEKYLGWWRRVGGECWFRQKVVLKKTIFSVIVDGVKQEQEMEGGGKWKQRCTHPCLTTDILAFIDDSKIILTFFRSGVPLLLWGSHGVSRRTLGIGELNFYDNLEST